MRHSLYHLGSVRRGPSCLAFPCKIWRGYLWGETHQGQREETAEKERHWELLLPAWLSPTHPLSPLQQTFQGEDWPDQPSAHTPHPPWYEVLVIFACEGRTYINRGDLQLCELCVLYFVDISSLLISEWAQMQQLVQCKITLTIDANAKLLNFT